MKKTKIAKILIATVLLFRSGNVMAQGNSLPADPTRGLPTAVPDATMGKTNSHGCYSFLPPGPYSFDKDGHVQHSGSTNWSDHWKHVNFQDSGSGITYDIQFYINNSKDQQVSAARVTTSLRAQDGSTQLETKIYTFLPNNDHSCSLQHVVTLPNDKDHPDFDLRGCKEFLDLLRTDKDTKNCASYWHKEILHVHGHRKSISHWNYSDKPECKASNATWSAALQKAGNQCNNDGDDQMMVYTQDYFAAFPQLKATDVTYSDSPKASRAR